jgi:genome maintenance exonuclease 1
MFNMNKRSKYFDLQYLPEYALPTETVNGKRHYITPDGNRYPSVTTVLSTMSSDGIAAWRKRVGEEAANKVSTQASGRGTKVHQIAEDYLRNKDNYLDGHMPANIETFNQIKQYIDLHVDQVYGNEIALYSDDLRTAGRCDLVGRVHGVRTIGDFKTAKKHKKEEWILNYFYQCTAYALMLYEREGVWCPQICLMIGTDEDGLQPILKKTSSYVESVRDFFDTYHKNAKLLS